MQDLQRMHIHQPNHDQEHHKYHGQNILTSRAIPGGSCTVYFTTPGTDHRALTLPRNILKPGWLPPSITKTNPENPWTSPGLSLIDQLLRHGVRVTVSKHNLGTDHSDYEYEIPGFYKSETIKLSPSQTGDWFAMDRYAKLTRINELQDLIDLNYDWWINSRTKGWENPTEPWASLMIKAGLIEAETRTIYKPKSEH